MISGSWQLIMCGASHQTSSLRERERIQVRSDELARANASFGALDAVMESALVSTCNRVEFYFVASRDNDPLDVIARFYREFRDLDLEPNRGLFRVKKGKHAGDHLFRVAAGIDSMVLGENQILGQIKTAYSSACAVKSAGKVIHRLFHQAFRVGKQVRSDTGIGKGACSVSTAAVEMVSDAVGAVERPSIVLVGVNQMMLLAAKRLAQVNGVRLSIANRSPDKARRLAADLGEVESAGYGMEELPELIATADIVISCTSSPGFVITREMLEEAASRRPGRRLTVVDLAIPRDVEAAPAPAGNPGATVSVHDLEDIQRFVADRQKQREAAVGDAEDIIERRLDEFDYWYGQVRYEPLYNGNGREAEAIREEELAPILKKLPPALQNELKRATRRLVERVVKAAKTPPDDKTD